MDKAHIESRVRALYEHVRSQKERLGIDARDPIEELEPALAAASFGYKVQEVSDLGRAPFREGAYTIAGELEKSTKSIKVSLDFRRPERRFTAAHELGHLALKHTGRIFHRERPSPSSSRHIHLREPMEREADYFAACFLMPQELVLYEFERRFGTRHPLILDEKLSFWLSHGNPMQLENLSSDELAAVVAGFSNSRAPTSLSDRFGVTVSAMAYRLVELNLV